MPLFKPAEVRVIVALSVILLIGSVLNLLKREGKIAALDLGIFRQEKSYNYKYDIDLDNRQMMVDSTVDLNIVEATIPELKLIDINSAGFYDLQTLPGVGPAIAEKIVAYRDSVGRFERIEDLTRVKGIGPAKFELMKDKIELK